jgi:DNA-binding LytR/AlgR family response regulator
LDENAAAQYFEKHFADIVIKGSEGVGALWKARYQLVGTFSEAVFISIVTDSRHSMSTHVGQGFKLTEDFTRSELALILHKSKEVILQRRLSEFHELVTAYHGYFSGTHGASTVYAQQPQRSTLRGRRVDWVESEGNYIVAHSSNEALRVRSSLASLLRQLGPQGFVRLSRTAIANVAAIKQVLTGRGGTRAILDCGTSLAISRRNAPLVQERFREKEEAAKAHSQS